MTITREEKFGKGAYSITLAEDVAQKVEDSFSGFDGLGDANLRLTLAGWFPIGNPIR